MLRLHVLQAQFGDCLLLEYGDGRSGTRWLLIDGGPETTYDSHLAPELDRIAATGATELDLVVLSHVDNDHVIGLLDFLSESRARTAGGQAPRIGVSGVWHNSFTRTMGPAVEARLAAAFAASAAARFMSETGAAVNGISEGNSLRRQAAALELDINKDFADDLICVDDAPPPMVFGDLTLHVVGPTRANLAELQQQWEKWLDDHEDEIASGDPLLAANADRSVPNLSSIMLLAEADGKKLLLTGDGRSDHLLQGLRATNFLPEDGTLHVDVLKVAHHGSERNATKRFFRTVTADTYVFSANGKDDNPDLATLIWIVETAKDAGRPIELVFTNETLSTAKLRAEYDPNEFGYTTRTRADADHSIVVDVAP